MPEAAVVDVALQLLRIRRTFAVAVAVAAAPAGQQAHARRALMTDDVIGVIAVQWRAIGMHQTGQAQTRTEINQY